MKFGYAIVYVSSVAEALDFYHRAFGLETRFLHESGEYGELNTGETTLAFASHAMGEMNLAEPYQKADPSAPPFGIELAFVTADVHEAYAKAIKAGAAHIKEPTLKPWGQLVAYVRSIEGSLIELCTPIQDGT